MEGFITGENTINYDAFRDYFYSQIAFLGILNLEFGI